LNGLSVISSSTGISLNQCKKYKNKLLEMGLIDSKRGASVSALTPQQIKEFINNKL
jgi:hypothetical protein